VLLPTLVIGGEAVLKRFSGRRQIDGTALADRLRRRLSDAQRPTCVPIGGLRDESQCVVLETHARVAEPPHLRRDCIVEDRP